jgi:hypothetical protein
MRTITKYTWLDLTINRQTQTHNLLVTGLGKQKIILRYLWFKQTNPDINWKECMLTWQTKQDEKNPTPKTTIKNEINPEDWLSTRLKNWMINKLEMQFCSLTLRRQNQRSGSMQKLE